MVDRDGKTLDFTLSECHDQAAVRRFFRRAIGSNGLPERVVIDRSGAKLAGLQAINVILRFTGSGRMIEIRQVKYLNNILEQDHRFIKRITRPMMGFKAFLSAAATIAGIEAVHMIRKGQIPANGETAFQIFAGLAALICPQIRLCRQSEKFATEPAQVLRLQQTRGSLRSQHDRNPEPTEVKGQIRNCA